MFSPLSHSELLDRWFKIIILCEYKKWYPKLLHFLSTNVWFLSISLNSPTPSLLFSLCIHSTPRLLFSVFCFLRDESKPFTLSTPCSSASTDLSPSPPSSPLPLSTSRSPSTPYLSFSSWPSPLVWFSSLASMRCDHLFPNRPFNVKGRRCSQNEGETAIVFRWWFLIINWFSFVEILLLLSSEFWCDLSKLKAITVFRVTAHSVVTSHRSNSPPFSFFSSLFFFSDLRL